MSPVQKILFGSPGTEKSYKVNEIAEKELGINRDKQHSNIVKTVFHPEYKYSDFMGKLLPFSSGNSIIYKYYPGYFLQVLGKAYRSIIDDKEKEQNYLLVIDELNRGNAAAIFGSVFQLLDRNNDGWSTYGINISDMEIVGLLNAMGYRAGINDRENISVDDASFERFIKDLQNKLKPNSELSVDVVEDSLSKKKIYIPPNLSIICTINTSDESIYYLDTAFKRRWDWEYIEAPSIDTSIPHEVMLIELSMPNNKLIGWYLVIIGVNEFIKSCHSSIRKIEDKQIGWWFIIPEKIWEDNPERFPYRYAISFQQVRDKLMFYLWDSVFGRDKKPLIGLLENKLQKKNIKLTTYADFLQYSVDLIEFWHDSVPAIDYEDEDSLYHF